MSAPRAPIEYDCFAIAAPGLEPVLAQELRDLAAAPGEGAPWLAAGIPLRAITPVAGGVEFRTEARGLAEVLLQVRTASRVVVRLATFRATAFHELERAARQVEWARVLRAGAPFRLRVTCRKSRLYHSDAVAERVAGAAIRAVPGAVWTDDADDEAGDDANEGAPMDAQLFVVRLDRDRCTISADASGALLHRRGYRQALARAPMRETLAAALLLAAEWDPRRPLVDPMCGSGTIPIEAALLARRMAPGLGRRFAAEQWPETAAATWAAAREAAARRALPAAPAGIVGADRDAGAVEAARANASRAGVAADVEFRQGALSALVAPPGPGLLASNPPYGVRVGEATALRSLYAALGRLLATELVGWDAVLLSPGHALLGQTRLQWRTRARTRNGGLGVDVVTRAGAAR